MKISPQQTALIEVANFANATAMERTTAIIQDQLMVSINGTLPDISTLGTEEKSERAAEVKKQQDTNTNTSCSLFAKVETSQKMLHLLVDIGQGVVKSIERDLGRPCKPVSFDIISEI